MTDITIDHPHGFETTFSTDPESPAAPFLQRLSPKRFEDFYDIGLIPAHIPIDHLRTAREIGLRASARHFDISNLASVGLGRSPVESRRLIVARSKSKALDASAGAGNAASHAHAGEDSGRSTTAQSPAFIAPTHASTLA